MSVFAPSAPAGPLCGMDPRSSTAWDVRMHSSLFPAETWMASAGFMHLHRRTLTNHLGTPRTALDRVLTRYLP